MLKQMVRDAPNVKRRQKTAANSPDCTEKEKENFLFLFNFSSPTEKKDLVK